MRLAYFCDGTWNDPASDTNVFRLYHGTLVIPGVQDARYDDGVGVEGLPIDKLLGGAAGKGLVNKVKDGYSKIAHVYTTGDDLFLFGFSRGAYTARSIAGMIAVCGLPTQNLDTKCVDTVWQAYRDSANRDMLLNSLADYAMDPAKITMVGVWDTVGALGIPALWGGIDDHFYGFLDTGLHPNVLNACQALAIDEERKQFPPTLWTTADAPGQVVEQVWFSGVHCDVGGGYPPGDADNGTRLADISLAWMLERAQLLGLQVDPGFAASYPPETLKARYALNALHNSRQGVFSIAEREPRAIPATSILASSVAVRCQHDPAYAPGNLKIAAGALDPCYNVSRCVAEPDPPLPLQF